MLAAFKKVLGILSQRKNSQSSIPHGNDVSQLVKNLSKINWQWGVTPNNKMHPSIISGETGKKDADHEVIRGRPWGYQRQVFMYSCIVGRNS